MLMLRRSSSTQWRFCSRCLFADVTGPVAGGGQQVRHQGHQGQISRTCFRRACSSAPTPAAAAAAARMRTLRTLRTVMTTTRTIMTTTRKGTGAEGGVLSSHNDVSTTINHNDNNSNNDHNNDNQDADNAGTISPILLQRARTIAAEHGQLSSQISTSYTVEAAKRMGELAPIAEALREWDVAHSSLTELYQLLEEEATTTTDRSNGGEEEAELRALAISEISTIRSSLPTLARRLSTALIPAHPFAEYPCLIELHPGAGGSEASLFAHELLQMYIAYCSAHGLAHRLQSYEADDAVSQNALTHAILAINAPAAYNRFRSEAGVHRVQRVPATEKKGRTHTSAVSVMVLPQLPEVGESAASDYNDPNSDYYIAPSDVRSETMRARGAGGQHVNKTDSAVRLTHIPTGLVVAMQEDRSQHKNRERAWALLRAKLAARKREEREAETVALRRKAMGGVARTGREDKVRTYNFSQNRVTDHRSGWEGSDLEDVLGGGDSLEGLMASVRDWMDENEVKGLIADEQAKRTK